MATLAELRSQVRDLLGDAGTEATTWTNTQVDAAINQACLNYCEKTGVTYIESLITVDSFGMVLMPTPYLSVVRVMTSAGGNPYS